MSLSIIDQYNEFERKITEIGLEFCEICWNNLSDPCYDFEVVTLSCEHMYCRECFSNYFDYMVDDHNNENDFKCPLTDCYYVPNDSEMKWIIEPEKYLKYKNFKKRII